jgi:hypothetical protein
MVFPPPRLLAGARMPRIVVAAGKMASTSGPSKKQPVGQGAMQAVSLQPTQASVTAKVMAASV